MQPTGSLVSPTYTQHVPDAVKGKLVEPESPVIIISTSSSMGTGKGITQVPTDFINIGPIVGVPIVSTSSIVKTVVISY